MYVLQAHSERPIARLKRRIIAYLGTDKLTEADLKKVSPVDLSVAIGALVAGFETTISLIGVGLRAQFDHQ